MQGLRSFAAALALAAPAAWAQSFYAGGSLGHSRLGSVDLAVTVARSGSTFTPPSVHAEMDPSTGGKIFAGVGINRWLAVEADYTRPGTVSTSFAYEASDSFLVADESRARLEAFGVSAVARFLEREGLAAFARLGVAATRLRYENETCIANFTFVVLYACDDSGKSLRQTRPVAGLGVDYRFSDHFTARFGWDRYFGIGENVVRDENGILQTRGKFDVDLFSAGVYYRF